MQMAQRILLCISLLFLLVQSYLTSDLEIVSIQERKRSASGLVEELRVTINVRSRMVDLNLMRVQHISPNIPVHSVSSMDTEEGRIEQENVSKSQNVGCYQDVTNGAALVVTEVKNAESGESTFLLTGNFLYDGEQYSIKTVQEEHGLETTGRNCSYVLEKVSPRPFTGTDYIRPPAATKGSAPVKRSANLHKPSKRDSTHHVIVDVIAIADHSLFRQAMKHSKHVRQDAIKFLQEHFAFIFNGLDLIYQKIVSTKVAIRVKLVKIIIIENYKDFKLHHLNKFSNKIDAQAALETLQKFVVATNLTEHSDHVMLFLGHDLWIRSKYLYFSLDEDLFGVALISTLCGHDGKSISVVEDMPRYEYEVLATAAHELAHSMSVEHDGSDNSCSDYERFLMATSPSDDTNGTRLHPWHFSNCSVSYLEDFIVSKLETDEGKICLTASFPVNPDLPDVSDKYFGQVVPPNEQCRQTYGKGSYYCKVGYDVTEMCTAMHCYDPLRYSCFPQKALAGTKCGENKICQLGQCEEIYDYTTMSTTT